MAVNLSSKLNPVRIVYNSSLSWKGQSLNTSCSKGPDMLNSLHGVLLRFREDYIAAQGDIKKMFYQVKIAEDKQYMQLWLWKFPDDDDIRTFCMTRLVMGNICSPALSIVTVLETAELGNDRKRYPVTYQTLKRDSYLDNVC